MAESNIKELERIVEETLDRKIKSYLETYLIEREKRYENISLLERIVRVEESLANINKRLEDFIRQVDRRFEQVDKRFEAVDKRFEDLIHYMDKRFEAVDKRFEDLNKRIGFISWFVPTIITIVVVVLKFV